MTENVDRAVDEILREISTRDGATGVSFHQNPTATARYLTVVRMLAEEAESDGTETGPSGNIVMPLTSES
jgi:hypothetical protein